MKKVPISFTIKAIGERGIKFVEETTEHITKEKVQEHAKEAIEKRDNAHLEVSPKLEFARDGLINARSNNSDILYVNEHCVKPYLYK